MILRSGAPPQRSGARTLVTTLHMHPSKKEKRNGFEGEKERVRRCELRAVEATRPMSRLVFCSIAPDEPYFALECKLAPGTTSGFKGVSKLREGCFRARAWVAGKGMRTVSTDRTAEGAAWDLAAWYKSPYTLPSPPKRQFKASDDRRGGPQSRRREARSACARRRGAERC